MKVNGRVDAFVSPSKFLMEKMIHYGYPAEKFVHIPSFVDQPPSDQLILTGIISFLSVALRPTKVLKHWWRGFKLLLESAPEARLVIAGEISEEAKRLQEIIRQEQIGQIEFPGYIDKQHFSEVMNGAIATVCLQSVMIMRRIASMKAWHLNGLWLSRKSERSLNRFVME